MVLLFIEREKLHGKSINHDGGSASFGTVLRECMFSMETEIKYRLSRREKMTKNQPIMAVPYLLVPYQRKEQKIKKMKTKNKNKNKVRWVVALVNSPSLWAYLLECYL
jgi:hypothetical protein